MRRQFLIYPLLLTLLTFLQGCNEVGADASQRRKTLLVRADTLMDSRPDSALQLLNTLLPDTGDMSEGERIRFHLLRTNAQNKCDTVFTARHASLMRRVWTTTTAAPPSMRRTTRCSPTTC